MGGVLLSDGEKMDSVVIENNKFLNCYVARTKYVHGYWAKGILLHLKRGTNEIIVTGNRFSGCECRENGDEVDHREAYITEERYFMDDADSAYETDNVCEGPVRRIFE